jgi:hypothetical protein
MVIEFNQDELEMIKVAMTKPETLKQLDDNNKLLLARVSRKIVTAYGDHKGDNTKHIQKYRTLLQNIQTNIGAHQEPKIWERV